MGPGQYLFTAFCKLGFGREETIAGMAVVSFMKPHSWQEIKAFADATGHVSAGWEIECLMDMSRAYCAELSLAADGFRISPMDRALAQKPENSDIAREPVT